MKNFFNTLWSDVKGMWSKAPAVEVAAASALNALVPVVEGIDVLATPELAPIINPILDKVKVGLTALKTTIQGAGPKINLSSIIASVTANLSALESAVQVKNPETAQKINAIAAIVNGELQNISAGGLGV